MPLPPPPDHEIKVSIAYVADTHTKWICISFSQMSSLVKKRLVTLEYQRTLFFNTKFSNNMHDIA